MRAASSTSTSRPTTTRTPRAWRRRRRFLDAWTVRLHALQLSLRALHELQHDERDARRAGSATRRSTSPTTSGSPAGTTAQSVDPATPVIPDTAWPNHQRIHQFTGRSQRDATAARRSTSTTTQSTPTPRPEHRCPRARSCSSAAAPTVYRIAGGAPPAGHLVGRVRRSAAGRGRLEHAFPAAADLPADRHLPAERPGARSSGWRPAWPPTSRAGMRSAAPSRRRPSTRPRWTRRARWRLQPPDQREAVGG